MTNKRPDLGKGIRALLENMDTSLNNDAAILNSTSNIPLDQIEPAVKIVRGLIEKYCL